jgi:hypothetical protein
MRLPPAPRHLPTDALRDAVERQRIVNESMRDEAAKIRAEREAPNSSVPESEGEK